MSTPIANILGSPLYGHEVSYRSTLCASLAVPICISVVCLLSRSNCNWLSPSHYLGLTTTRLSISYGTMDGLSQIAGLHTNLARREFVDILSLQPVSSLRPIRTSLFTEAQACQNTIPDGLQGLPLVSRRDSVLRPFASILSHDLVYLPSSRE